MFWRKCSENEKQDKELQRPVISKKALQIKLLTADLTYEYEMLKNTTY